jgi:hypothetical protein
MTLVSLHRQRGSDFAQPFTDPRELRRRLQRGLADAPQETRERALAIAGDIDQRLAAHQRKTEAIMAEYVDNMHSRYRDAEALSQYLAPLDAARQETLLDIVARRGKLRALLTRDQWQAVFRD